ncbi:MAG: hypothetical protein A4S09_10020 [Proteobacteria bacterium SG_bin7]|nr:MAG: hypothetical protein A4S09_10020 [Proteobacteria bacterium SG_bin7]
MVILIIGLFLGVRFYLEAKKISRSAHTVSAWKDDHRADCAVVLTGGMGRVRDGIDLLAQKQVSKLILAGVYTSSKFEEIFPLWPYYGSVNKKDVILERRSQTTYGNAQQALSLVEALRCRDIVLITSNLHMPRAYRTFRAIFPETIPIYQRGVPTGPRAGAGYGDLFFETLKSTFYSLWAY